MAHISGAFVGALMPNDNNWKPQSVGAYHAYEAAPADGWWQEYWRMRSHNGRFDDIITLPLVPLFMLRRSVFALFRCAIALALGLALSCTLICIPLGFELVMCAALWLWLAVSALFLPSVELRFILAMKKSHAGRREDAENRKERKQRDKHAPPYRSPRPMSSRQYRFED